MKFKFYLLIILFSLGNFVFAKHIYPEKYYQDNWCRANSGVTEYRLQDFTRIDCLTLQYAVEFDFAPKWAESIGQSLYYASKTGKTPAIGLIIEKQSDYKYYYRILPLCQHLGIALFKI